MLDMPQCSWQTMEKSEKPSAVWVTRNGKIRKPSSGMFDLMFTSIYLKEYFSYVLSCTQHFPEMKAAIKNRQQSNVARNEATSSAPSSTSGEDDEHHLVGFGPYKLMSHFNLYNSTQDEHMRYVTSILNTNVTYPGGQLDKLKRYIEREDRPRQQEQLEDQLLFKAAEEAELRHETDSAPPQPATTTVPVAAVPSQEPRAVEKVRWIIFSRKSIIVNAFLI